MLSLWPSYESTLEVVHLNFQGSFLTSLGDKKSVIQDDASVAPSDSSEAKHFALDGIEIQFGGGLDKRSAIVLTFDNSISRFSLSAIKERLQQQLETESPVKRSSTDKQRYLEGSLKILIL